MKLALEIQQKAREELLSTLLQYASRNLEVAYSFDEAVNNAYDFLLDRPFGRPISHGTLRRINIGKFPWALLYAVELREHDLAHVVIVSCVHQHSDPDNWPEAPE